MTLAQKAKNTMSLLIWRSRYALVYLRFRAYTMIPQHTYISNLILMRRHRHVPGAVVECGTWKGGMIAGMASMLGRDRSYYLYDSFEGLPPAKEIDGPSALMWQKSKDSKDYFDNCTADEADARAAMQKAGINYPVIMKGWFNETLPGANFPDGIAILRMDADWYDSTMDIFIHLFEKVNPNGLILIDDYYTWDGCTRAVHDYLSQNQRPERICTYGGVCYVLKK